MAQKKTTTQRKKRNFDPISAYGAVSAAKGLGRFVPKQGSVDRFMLGRNPKSPREMSGAELNHALDKIDAEGRKIIDAMIDAGRGHDVPSRYLREDVTDPLSRRAQANWKARTAITNEIAQRVGPGMSRVPGGRGFGPRRNPEDIDFINDLTPAVSHGHVEFTHDGLERYVRDGYVYVAYSATPVQEDGYRVGTVEGYADSVNEVANPHRRNPNLDSPFSTTLFNQGIRMGEADGQWGTRRSKDDLLSEGFVARWVAEGRKKVEDGRMDADVFQHGIAQLVDGYERAVNAYGKYSVSALDKKEADVRSRAIKSKGFNILSTDKRGKGFVIVFTGDKRQVEKVGPYTWGRIERANPGDTTAPSTGDVSSPTSTSADVSSPTSTKTATDALTSRNITVTGGAGAGANTTVHIHNQPSDPDEFGRSHRSEDGDLVDAPMEGHFRERGPLPVAQFKSVNPRPNFTRAQDAELVNLFHLARTALSGKDDSRYSRMVWAANEFSKLHPEISGGWAYKHISGGLLEHGYRNPRRRNPASDASALYESFHGAPPSETLEIAETQHVHSHLAALGDLVTIDIKLTGGKNKGATATISAPDPARSSDERIVHVCSNESGNQIYFVGGDQALDLPALGFRESFDVKHDGETFDVTEIKDKMILGEITKLTYRTKKGFDDFDEIDYFHKLGEDTKTRPMLAYDTLSERMEVYGGEYHVHDVGLVN